MIKRNKEKIKKYGFAWAIVGGKIEYGEHSSEAIIREIKEEINVDLPRENLALLYVQEDPNWNNIAHVAFFIYGAVLDETSKINLNEEADEYAWFDVHNLPENRCSDDILSMQKAIKKIFNNK